MTIAEDLGYNDSYFPAINEDPDPSDYILSHSPPTPLSPMNLIPSTDVPAGRGDEREDVVEEVRARLESGDGFFDAPIQADEEVGVRAAIASTQQTGTHLSAKHPGQLDHIPSTAGVPSDLPQSRTPDQEGAFKSPNSAHGRPRARSRRKSAFFSNKVAEAVFFSYGVSVFFGFQESEERMIMEDCESAGVWARGQKEDDWEVEEFHYVVSNHIRQFCLASR